MCIAHISSPFVVLQPGIQLAQPSGVAAAAALLACTSKAAASPAQELAAAACWPHRSTWQDTQGGHNALDVLHRYHAIIYPPSPPHTHAHDAILDGECSTHRQLQVLAPSNCPSLSQDGHNALATLSCLLQDAQPA
jgi:hypothetical protein